MPLPLLLPLFAEAATPTLKPIKPWNIEYAAESCLLTRDFGDPAAPVTLGIRAIPTSGYEIIVTSPLLGLQTGITGDVRLDWGAGREAGKARFEEWPDVEHRRRIASFETARANFASTTDLPSLLVALGKRAPVTFEMPGLKSGIAALEKCESDLLLQWKVDRAELARVATAAKLQTDLGQVYSSDSVPNSVREHEVDGTSMILMTITTGGQVSECHVIRNSGLPSLDLQTCRLAVARLRYTPAIGRDGQPMASHVKLKVRWISIGGL